MAKWAGQVGSIRLRVKIGNFKRVKNGFGSIGLRVGLGWVDPYFSHEIFLFYLFIYFYFKENMYLSFEKSCNKLLDVKCITLNLPLISRMNSVKIINTYSIILKLYKS